MVSAAVLFLAIINALACAGALFRVRQQSPAGSFANGATIIFGFLIVSYALRPAYAAFTDRVGTPTIGYASLQETNYLSAFLVMSIAIWAFVAAFFSVPHGGPKTSFKPRVHSKGMLLIVGGISAGAMLPVAQRLLSYENGVFAALTVRQNVFAGISSFIYLAALYKVAAIAYIACRIDADRPLSGVAVAMLVTPAVAIDAALGERAELLLGNVAIVGAVWMMGRSANSRRPARNRRNSILLIVALATIFAGYRSYVREGSGTLSPIAAVGDLPSFLLESGETAGLDYFVAARAAVPEVAPRPSKASYFSSILLAPLPSQVVSKPPRSSDTLTSSIAPSRYREGAIITFTAAGDLYYGLGDIGVVIGYAFLGAVSATIVQPRVPSRGRAIGTATSMYLGWLIIPVLRSDLFPLATLPVGIVLAFGARAAVLRSLSAPTPTAPPFARNATVD